MKNRTLYCVLNWGLGHASRSIPLIQDLINQGHELSIASDGLSSNLLKDAFPRLPFYSLPSYDINYRFESIAANLLGQCFKIIRAIRKENDMVSKIINEKKITHIISDNRYGCYHKYCHNIFVTHQLKLIHPNRFIQAAATRMNLQMISNFDECWIPDSPNSELSGEMNSTTELSIPKKYIGIQSRFNKIPSPKSPKYETISILSGPEPQRSYFQNELENQLKDIKGEHVIVTGKLNKDQRIQNLIYKSICDHETISKLASQARFIISRSGYSSLMDYEAMERKAIIVPTPGQSEQEYLASIQGLRGRHIFMKQDSLDLISILK